MTLSPLESLAVAAVVIAAAIAVMLSPRRPV